MQQRGKNLAGNEPFPRRLAFSVWLVQFYNGIQYSLPFTLGVFLVRSFEGEDATEQRIGQLSGLLAAASSFAVGCSAWPWGLCSDRWLGRKAVILIGNVATSCAIVMFGSARRYTIALAARFIAGILDGSLVMTKVMVGETCSPNMQARVMSFLALGDAMGTIIGPALGGLLAEPCTRFGFLRSWGFCSDASLLQQRPYLLPCLVSASLGVVTTISNVFTMDETLPRMSGKGGGQYTRLHEEEEKATELLAKSPVTPTRARSCSLDLSTTIGPVDSVVQHVSESKLVSQPNASHPGTPRARPHHLELSHLHARRQDAYDRPSRAEDEIFGNGEPAAQEEDEGCEAKDDDLRDESENGQRRRLLPHDSVASTGGWARRKSQEKDGGLEVRWNGKRVSEAGPSPSTSEIEVDEDAVESASPKRDPESGHEILEEAPWWQNRSLLLTLLVTAWMLSICKYCDELTPVFVSAPIANGGLHMPMDQFAWPLSFGGVCVTVYALFIYPRLQRLLGLKGTCSFGLLLGVPFSLIIPCCALLLAHSKLKQVVLFSGVGLAYLQKQTAFTSSMVIINTLAPRGQLGSVNGVRMTLAALGRATGPIAGGFLWGYSASLHFPGHHFIGFAVASLAYAACWLLHHSIPLKLP